MAMLDGQGFLMYVDRSQFRYRNLRLGNFKNYFLRQLPEEKTISLYVAS